MAIYLDNAATSYPKPDSVQKEMNNYMQNIGVNPGRGAYQRALKAEQIVFSTRQALGDLFNIDDVSRIVFTANVTEALNLAIKGFVPEKSHVITTSFEHNAVWRPLKHLQKEKEVKISTIGAPDRAFIDKKELEEAHSKNTELVIINHASNVTGAIAPLETVGEFCQEKNLPLLVDSAQTAGILPIDVQEYNISMLGFTGHKGLLGPTGTGGLYIDSEIELAPLKEGGTGSKSYLERQPEDLPDRFEAGTVNSVGLAGLKSGVEYLLQRGIEEIRQHELQLTEYLLDVLGDLQDCEIYSPLSAEDLVAVVSVNLADIPAEEAAYVLDDVYDIMVRAGLHCSPQAHKMLGTEDRGSLRFSPGIFNSKQDIERAGEALKKILQRGTGVNS
ncbi:aminotransferase class V-fold PLP-dependent enzyme [Halarsenatibacter silvermanii]|uniref:cysteine desulfurase n=1 Tax=Halarsenatibacter silvermanii TaxID=321763 RepID=A0A1G9IVV2_9FIRM|nr:aminotransferase class V-fold PLP-dependent enzyme [Halarsenatibacter silvermanii]SDL29185.1 cysteine desulfurase family protein [Halarsenatibacter silvermanii]